MNKGADLKKLLAEVDPQTEMCFAGSLEDWTLSFHVKSAPPQPPKSEEQLQWEEQLKGQYPDCRVSVEPREDGWFNITITRG